MLELAVFGVTLLAARILAAPLLRRIATPGWFERARRRGRPGIPVTTVLAALLLMSVLWWIGERRGVFGAILLALWIGVPLAAFEILRAFRRGRSRGEVRPPVVPH